MTDVVGGGGLLAVMIAEEEELSRYVCMYSVCYFQGWGGLWVLVDMKYLHLHLQLQIKPEIPSAKRSLTAHSRRAGSLSNGAGRATNKQ